MVAVQVDAAREGGVVAHDDPGRLAARKPAPRPFRKARPVIEGPEVATPVPPAHGAAQHDQGQTGRTIPVRLGYAGRGKGRIGASLGVEFDPRTAMVPRSWGPWRV